MIDDSPLIGILPGWDRRREIWEDALGHIAGHSRAEHVWLQVLLKAIESKMTDPVAFATKAVEEWRLLFGEHGAEVTE